jgi:hypothetical protein
MVVEVWLVMISIGSRNALSDIMCIEVELINILTLCNIFYGTDCDSPNQIINQCVGPGPIVTCMFVCIVVCDH